MKRAHSDPRPKVPFESNRLTATGATRHTAQVILPLTLALLIVGPVVLAALDVMRTSEQDLPHFPQTVWLAVVIFIPILGPVAWVLTGRPPAALRLGPATTGGHEDDEAFMRHIRARAEDERRRYEAERHRQQGEAGPAAEPPSAAA